jgi:hypothetical protein
MHVRYMKPNTFWNHTLYHRWTRVVLTCINMCCKSRSYMSNEPGSYNGIRRVQGIQRVRGHRPNLVVRRLRWAHTGQVWAWPDNPSGAFGTSLHEVLLIQLTAGRVIHSLPIRFSGAHPCFGFQWQFSLKLHVAWCLGALCTRAQTTSGPIVVCLPLVPQVWRKPEEPLPSKGSLRC